MTDRTDELGIEIKHREHGRVIYATTTTSLRAAVIEAVGRGAYLTGAYLGGAYLTGADLTGAYLGGANLTGAYLTDANLTGAYLTDAYLTDANLTDANLRDAYLRDAYLTGANLRDAKGLPLDMVPLVENLDAQILAAVEASQALGKAGLNMEHWHTCESTHCRAGWAIHLAGKEGYALEERYGSPLAGALIYAKAGATRVPNFYATDEAAMADMRERAAGAA